MILIIKKSGCWKKNLIRVNIIILYNNYNFKANNNNCYNFIFNNNNSNNNNNYNNNNYNNNNNNNFNYNENNNSNFKYNNLILKILVMIISNPQY